MSPREIAEAHVKGSAANAVIALPQGIFALETSFDALVHAQLPGSWQRRALTDMRDAVLTRVHYVAGEHRETLEEAVRGEGVSFSHAVDEVLATLGPSWPDLRPSPAPRA